MLKNIIISIFVILFLSSESGHDNNFLISNISAIYIAENSDQLINWAAHDFASDLEIITGRKIPVNNTNIYEPKTKGIYIGQFGSKLVKNFPEDYSGQLQNQWEKFIIKKQGDNIIITGSDIRGTVYGVFDLAERTGISPWKWWADVSPVKNENLKLNLPPEGIEAAPSVHFRGIFLNDEDWGLQPWAAQTFEPETKDIGPKTYEKIFQLLLRLKANTIWPAMHSCTKAFFSIKGNKEMAEKYHIYIGTSHAEPMLRNNVSEWDTKARGEFNYFTNKNKVKEYWQERISDLKNGNYIMTMGMRGIHDSGMEGHASLQQKVQLLETIINDQRQILQKTLNKPVEDIPQVFIPYKEVLELYNNGLKIPDDITLVWTDDNYGYIRRLSNKNEQQRKGGSGIYYHLSYWGRPHDYLWLSTTQPGLIWYEMSRAWQNGSHKIWIANVGDIKPAEYNMEFFLDLAWNINSISKTTIETHLFNWCAREFGKSNAPGLTDLFREYYRLAFLRKPEFMGWSRTEPITSTRPTEFTSANNNEIQRRIDSYRRLYNKADNIKLSIPEERQDAYFQLVEYPVKCAALMNFKFLYAQQAYLSGDKNEKDSFSSSSRKAYEEITRLTEKYNTGIRNGKWNKIMDMHPRNLPAYDMPEYYTSDTDSIDTTKTGYENLTAPVFIQAKDFEKAENMDAFEWRIIEGLGYSNAAITLFPLKNRYFKDKLPYVEYTFNIEKAGQYEIEVRCLPTHSNNFDQQVIIQVNSGELKYYNINTKGRSEEWKVNVLRNYTSVKYPVSFDDKGEQTLRIFVNQTGIVIDQIAVNPADYPNYYEIPVKE